MNKSPGHQQWPNHKIRESHLGQRVTVEINGSIVADSRDVIQVDEDGHPARFYFPRSDVQAEVLRRSAAITQCPFKGAAHYYDVQVGDDRFSDAVWTYEAPYDEHRELKDRLAFYDGKIPEIRIRLDA